MKDDRNTGIFNIRLATKEEIEKAQIQIFKVGNFEIKVINKRAIHKSEDISSFIISMYNNMKVSGHLAGYQYEISEIIFKRTGCESTSTLTEWMKVYDAIK